MAAQTAGRDPKLGSEVGFVVVVKAKGKVNVDAVMKLMMETLEEEEGPEARKKVESTRKTQGGTTYLTLPKELMTDPSVDSDMLMSMSAGEKGSVLALGVPAKVMAYNKAGKLDPSFACLNILAKDRQVTFAMSVPPSVWTQPGMNFDNQNPLMAGLANAVKGIREFGLSVSFREETLGLEICVNCVDAQSALGLWTVAQGGLGMAQLAASQEGQAPAILNRIKTQALEKNVVVKVEVLPSDLDEFAGMAGLPQPSEAPASQKRFRFIDWFACSRAQGNSFGRKGIRPVQTEGESGGFGLLGDLVRALRTGFAQLMKATSSFPENKVVFVAVNQGEKTKQIKKFLKQKNWESLSVALDPQRKAGDDFQVEGIPQTVIIDKKGKVRHVHVGFSPDIGSRLKKEVQSLLSE